MTKEELEKEIKKYIDKNCNQWETDGLTVDDIVRVAVLDFAEPREKRIEELEQKLEQTEKDLADYQFNYPTIKELQKENTELKKVAEFQQSSNMNTHLENKKLKEGLAVGSTWNKHLNSLNKELEEERDKYRNMVFDKDEQLTKAKELLERLLITSCNSDVLNLLPNCSEVLIVRVEAEQFLNSELEK